MQKGWVTRKSVTYESRYRFKLNMFDSGQIMMKLVAVLILAGILFWIFHWNVLACIALTAAGVLFAVLLLLVAVELHQDRVLNEIALQENREREKNGEIF